MGNFMTRWLMFTDINKLKEILSIYRSAYRNWPSVLLRLALKRRARAIARDGRIIGGDDVLLGAIASLYASGLSNYVDDYLRLLLRYRRASSLDDRDVRDVLLAPRWLYKLRYTMRCCRLAELAHDLSYVVVNVKGRRIKLYGWYKIRFADIDDYISLLNIKGKSVLDVGAYVGDSAVLFAAMGARRTVAVEPSPWAYNMARKNVRINGLSDVITLVNCAVAREDGKVLMLPSSEINIAFRVTDNVRGDTPVPTCTLDTLIEKYGPFDVLKMDCEGCEHESIPYSRRIGEVREVLMEYHGGYEDIVRKLREEGFKNIRFSMSGEGGRLHKRPVSSQLGLVYASK